MEGLKTSTVHRKLDAKLKIAGLEVMDLIAVLLLAAVSNLIFGGMKLAPVFVLILPSTLAAVLYVAKRDRPEGFLLHLLRYWTTPGLYSAAHINEPLEQKRKRLLN
ncbi:MAG: type IV conjugative transfer system protein TraL [Bdellovibrionales bacterium]|nr:type IV conjugative transfer system protein TraL [Bdellovibrionales bacterium]